MSSAKEPPSLHTPAEQQNLHWWKPCGIRTPADDLDAGQRTKPKDRSADQQPDGTCSSGWSMMHHHERHKGSCYQTTKDAV